MTKSLVAISTTTLLVGVAATAHAGAFPPSFGLSARAKVIASALARDDTNNTTTPATTEIVFSNRGVSGQALAIADYGVLQTSATITKIPGMEPFNYSSAEAIFSEELTVTGGTGTGTITFHFNYTGGLSIPGDNGPVATSELEVLFTDGSSQSDIRQHWLISGNSLAIDEDYATTAFNFTFGVPFSFDVRLFTDVWLDEDDSGTAKSDFLNTAEIAFLEVVGGGNQVVVSAASGTTYAIPEPSTALIIFGGVLAVLRKR